MERAGAGRGARPAARARRAVHCCCSTTRIIAPCQRPEEMRALRSDGYDGVLAFGETLADVYRRLGLGRSRVRLARGRRHAAVPSARATKARARASSGSATGATTSAAQELVEFLLQPAREARPAARHLWRALSRRGAAHAARSMARAITAGCANAAAPDVFARHLATVHVPRRFYTQVLPGIPTIRVFEALACGIPLVSAPWDDCEHLFRAGEDFLMVRDGAEMARALRDAAVTIPSCATALVAQRPRDDPRAAHLRAPRRRAARRSSSSCVPDAAAGECRVKIAFYGSSLLSSYWNGAATYYRGLLRDLAGRGYDITFYEPDALRSAAAPRHRSAGLGAVGRLSGDCGRSCARCLPRRRAADVVVKASGVGVFDDELLDGIVEHARPGALKIFWDVDAPATLDEMRADADHPVRAALPDPRPRAHLWRRPAGRRGLRGLRRAPLRADLQRARSRRRIIRSPPDRALRGRPVLSRQPPARPRSAGRAVLPRARRGACRIAAS